MNHAVQTAFEKWKNDLVTSEGAPAGTLRVHMGKAVQYSTASEGIAWGMLIAVVMDNETNRTRPLFDGLWGYYKHYTNENGLMSWKIDSNGKIIDKGSATEADENAAMALMYAYQQWGDVNYLSAAKQLIQDILDHATDAQTGVVKPGVGWGGVTRMDPCYYDPSYYRIWSRQSPRWNDQLAMSFKLYDIFYNKNQSCLFPDWCDVDGNRTKHNYDCGYDACQVPMKIGMDYLFNGTGAKYLERMADWSETTSGGDPSRIVDGYMLDGTPTGKYHSAAFVGPMAVAAMVSKKHQAWLDKMYDYVVALPTGGDWGYYNDTIRMFSLIVISGNLPEYKGAD
jgi:endoglucanase